MMTTSLFISSFRIVVYLGGSSDPRQSVMPLHPMVMLTASRLEAFEELEKTYIAPLESLKCLRRA